MKARAAPVAVPARAIPGAVTARAIPGVVTAGAAGAFAALGVLAGTGGAVAAPLTASVAVVLAAPRSPAAHPRAVLVAHAGAALAGVATVLVLPPGAVAALVAVGLALVLSTVLRAAHPPALATACLVALSTDHLAWRPAAVLAGGAALLAVSAWTVGGLSGAGSGASVPGR